MFQHAVRMAGLAGCLVTLGGCIPYLYPTLSYTPALPIEAPADEVHVFRVDVDINKIDVSDNRFETFSEVPLKDSATIPAQFSPGLTNGMAMYFIALNYDFRSASTMRLRIYRPGFELIEVNSWDPAAPLIWKPAPTLSEQQRALDRLFPLDSMGFAPDDRKQQAALRFGAAEYRRLAHSASDEERATLDERAVRLEETANGRHFPVANRWEPAAWSQASTSTSPP